MVGTDMATCFLTIDGRRIAYDDTGGEGPLIVCIPGMGDVRAQYHYLRPALQDSGYRVVTMDIRGFGETDAEWADYSARAVGHDCLALIAHLGSERAFVLGNSFAAGSALWAAHDAPDHVAGVVLLGPIVRDQKMAPPLALAFNVGFSGPWRVNFWLAYWDSLYTTHKPDNHAEYKGRLGRNLSEPGRMDALLAMLTLSKADTTAILPEVRTPALIVMGSLDPDFDDAAAEAAWLANQLGAEQAIINGAGHYPHAEAPDSVAPLLVPFLHNLVG